MSLSFLPSYVPRIIESGIAGTRSSVERGREEQEFLPCARGRASHWRMLFLCETRMISEREVVKARWSGVLPSGQNRQGCCPYP